MIAPAANTNDDATGSGESAGDADPFARALAECAATQLDDLAARRELKRQRVARVAAWWETVNERLPSGFDEQQLAVASNTRPEVRATVERLARWNPLGSEWRLVLGPTGVGKTWGVIARLAAARRYLEGLVGELPRLPWVVWTREQDVVEAARKHKLGAGDAPLLEALRGRERFDRRGVPFCDDRTSADLAIIDEAGYCGDSEALRRVLDVRYGAKRATVVTTGLTLKEFGSAEHYGGAVLRRLIEGQLIVDLHSSGGGR